MSRACTYGWTDVHRVQKRARLGIRLPTIGTRGNGQTCILFPILLTVPAYVSAPALLTPTVYEL